jgi:putative aldouronate transport system substrate-binding protein
MRTRVFALMLAFGLAVAFGWAEGGKETAKPAARTIEGFHATGWPIVDKPVTLKVLTQINTAQYKKQYSELKLVQQWEKDTNVKVEWTTLDGAAWTEKKNLLLASGDKLPDVILWQITDFDILTYAPQGYWQPLQDLIQKYTTNLKNTLAQYPDVYKSLIAPDGNIYSIPRFKGQLDMAYPNRLYLNKKWIDKLGLKVPETLGDFEAMLAAFKNRDPNGNGKPDEIPFAFLYNAAMSNRTSTAYRHGPYGFFGTFGRFDTPDHMVLENGKILFTADKPEYKAAVAWYRKAMENGWIDREAFTMDPATYKAKNTGASYVYGLWTGWTMEETTKNTADDVANYVQMGPLTNVNGKKIWPKFTYNQYQRGYFQITKDCKIPEVAIRWIDYFCDPYFSIQNDWGIEGLGTQINRQDGTWKIMGAGHANVRAAEGLPWVAPTFVPPSIYAKAVYTDPAKKAENEGCQAYEPYAIDVPPAMYVPLQEAAEMNQLGTDISTYVAKMTAKWITEGGIDADWDTYIATLKKMNLDRYVSVYSDSYERFKKAK